MAGVKAKGLRVDFICVHHYVDLFEPVAATADLKRFLEGVYKKYRLPIWVTEYALIRWGKPTVYGTPSQQAAFAKSSVAMMDGLPFVERHAWFALPPRECGTRLDHHRNSFALQQRREGHHHGCWLQAGRAAIPTFPLIIQ